MSDNLLDNLGLTNEDDKITILNQCPICKYKYNRNKALNLVKIDKNQSLFHIQCPKCHNAFLVSINVLPQGIGVIGITTDLNFPEAKKFANRQPINNNQLLEFHQIINKNHLNKLIK